MTVWLSRGCAEPTEPAVGTVGTRFGAVGVADASVDAGSALGVDVDVDAKSAAGVDAGVGHADSPEPRADGPYRWLGRFRAAS
ncbi:hypothetical protein ABZ468_55890 [Streptomyces sp. NPDC005708]|uniref:hypothetical protein n=1 Tax=Streptomyces sp. NPDC005708 TaxID=3154564 RepID=UPI0033C1A7D1